MAKLMELNEQYLEKCNYALNVYLSNCGVARAKAVIKELTYSNSPSDCVVVDTETNASGYTVGTVEYTNWQDGCVVTYTQSRGNRGVWKVRFLATSTCLVQFHDVLLDVISRALPMDSPWRKLGVAGISRLTW